MINRYKILIVDDLPENIQTLTRCYESLHPEYILYQATSGKAALDLAGTMKIDLIVSDWDMPGMSGIDLVRSLKANAHTAHIPVIIITGVMLSAADLDIALSAGACDYLRKPVESTELTARTHAAIHYVEMHMKELADKNLELTQKSMLLTRNNQFNLEICRNLKQLEGLIADRPDAQSIIRNILDDLDRQSKESNWGHFEMAFHNVHPEFCKNITAAFPGLTPGELRQCILIRLGMSNKNMASVLYQSPDSIRVNRFRIRKKLRVGYETNLQSFLCQI
jgi:CheY-like chemotaxis protein